MDIIFVFPICILILFIVSNIILSRYIFYKEYSLLKKSLVSMAISIVLYFLLELMIKYFLGNLSSKLMLRGLAKAFISIIITVMCIYVGYRFIQLLEDNNLTKDELKASTNKINNRNNVISKLRSQKHDYLKHLQVVYSLLDTGLSGEAKNYITSVSNSISSKTSRYGNISYLDAIASLKYEECVMKNISFDMYIQDFIDNLAIEPNDMSSVLINIIDNAMECLSSIDKENKYIKIFAYEDEFQYIIDIKNNGPKMYNTEDIFNEGFSAKDGQDRGYGLYLVKNILDKYGYYIFANSDDYVTKFTILIPKYS